MIYNIKRVNKCHTKIIPNYQKQLEINYQNTGRIFIGKLLIKHGKNIKNHPKEGQRLPEKKRFIKLSGVQLRKSMRRIPKGTGIKRKTEVKFFLISVCCDNIALYLILRFL